MFPFLALSKIGANHVKIGMSTNIRIFEYFGAPINICIRFHNKVNIWIYSNIRSALWIYIEIILTVLNRPGVWAMDLKFEKTFSTPCVSCVTCKINK